MIFYIRDILNLCQFFYKKNVKLLANTVYVACVVQFNSNEPVILVLVREKATVFILHRETFLDAHFVIMSNVQLKHTFETVASHLPTQSHHQRLLIEYLYNSTVCKCDVI